MFCFTKAVKPNRGWVYCDAAVSPPGPWKVGGTDICVVCCLRPLQRNTDRCLISLSSLQTFGPRSPSISVLYVLFKRFLLVAIIRAGGSSEEKRRCFLPPLEQKTEINPAPSEFWKLQIKLTVYQGEYQGFKCNTCGSYKYWAELWSVLHNQCLRA